MFFFQYLLDSRWADECMAKAFFNASSVHVHIYVYSSTPKRNTQTKNVP